jgi:hypothetical protein
LLLRLVFHKNLMKHIHLGFILNKPSDNPDPVKSNAKTVMFKGKSVCTASRASTLQPQFP